MDIQQKYRVLFVDSSLEFLQRVREAYLDFFYIYTATNLETALNILHEESIDTLVTGWYPQGFDGIEIIETVRRHYPFLHIFFYGEVFDDSAFIRAYRAGISDYFYQYSSIFQRREDLVDSVSYAVMEKQTRTSPTPESQMLNSIIELNPYSISVYDKNGHLVRYNQKYLNLFRHPMPRECIIFRLPAFEGDGDFVEMFHRFQQGESIHSDHRWYSIKGNIQVYEDNPVCLAVSGFSIKNQAGEIQNYVLMHEDVTQRVLAENAVKKAHEDLQDAHSKLSCAHEELKKYKDKLEQRVQERTAELTSAVSQLKNEVRERKKLTEVLAKKNQELESFASRVSHDLKNSLLMLRRIIELSSNDPGETQSTLKRLSQRSDQLMDFVDKLLNLAKAGRVIDRRRIQALDPFIRLAFQRIKPADIEGELHIPHKLPAIYGDIHAIENVFINLISNSFSYRDPDKEKVSVEITGRETPDSIEIVYRDNGIGIEPEYQDKAFDAGFTTLHKERSGFGLSIVKKIIEAHGGSITLASDGKGRGTQFTIILPAGKS